MRKTNNYEITVVEIIEARKGKVVKLGKALHELTLVCQKEEGCLFYECLEPAYGGTAFLILMQWKRIEDLARHENSSHVLDFIQKYEGVLYSKVTQTEWKHRKKKSSFIQPSS